MLLGDLIVKPKNSLICQSRDAAFHPGVNDDGHIRNIRVNGDGFGAAFYGPDPNRGSCVIKFVTPAWSNKNLINLGDYVYANLIMAHVRAASNGLDPFEKVAVSIENCHPFKYGRWTYMHNGGIPHFHRVKRALLNALSEECFQGITGSTDSEHVFALFLNHLPDRDAPVSVQVATIAIEKTVAHVLQLCFDAGLSEPCSLNMVFSDGVHVYATRFRNGLDSPPSLYYNYGSDFKCDEGCFANMDKDCAREIVVSSAPLSKHCSEDGRCGNWTLLPENCLLVCVGDEVDLSVVKKIYLKPINSHPPSCSIMPLMCRMKSRYSATIDGKTSLIYDHSSSVPDLQEMVTGSAMTSGGFRQRTQSCSDSQPVSSPSPPVSEASTTSTGRGKPRTSTAIPKCEVSNSLSVAASYLQSHVSSFLTLLFVLLASLLQFLKF